MSVYAQPNWQNYPARILPGAPVGQMELMQRLLNQGVATRPGIINAQQEPPHQGHTFPLPANETARSHVVLLPMFQDLSRKQVKTICRQLKAL